MKSLVRMVLGALDAELWKAILVLAAVAGAALLLHDALGSDTEIFIAVAVLVPLLYLALRYARHLLRFLRGGTPRQRMVTLLEILGIFHAIGLVSFFTIPFGAESLRNLYAELFEVDFWRNMQERNREGEVIDFFPYTESKSVGSAASGRVG